MELNYCFQKDVSDCHQIKLRYHIIDLPWLPENNGLSAHNCFYYYNLLIWYEYDTAHMV